ncbi:MAG: Zn-ribbon domain-containing protein [Nanoarchaeota archaeon]|nr:Zn-ribbon domain-containing protein [Nanoarchaeota archaeon]
MPHQCVHCGKIIEVASKEILEGCASCHGKFFFYIRDEQVSKIKESQELPIPEFDKVDKKQVEKDVREILNIEDDEKPVILNLESVRVLEPGKFEIDLVSLINRRSIVFKLEEGKYIIDIESSLPHHKKE